MQHGSKMRSRRKKGQSFLLQSPHEKDEVEADIPDQGPPKFETFLRAYGEGKERTSPAPPPANDSVPRTITKSTLLSRIADVTASNIQPPQTTFLQQAAHTLEITHTDYNQTSDDSNPSRNYTFLAPAQTAPDDEMVVPPHLRPKRAKAVATQVDKDKPPPGDTGFEAASKNVSDGAALKDGRAKATPTEGKDEAASFEGKAKAALTYDKGDPVVGAPPASINSSSIRQKLSEHHGVRVSDPKRAAIRPGPGLVPYPPSSSEAERGMSKRDSKLQNGSLTNKAHSGSNHSKRGHTNHHGRSGRAPKGSAFLKSSEIPKGDPKRWEINWDEDQNGTSSSLDSLRADFGIGNKKKKKKNLGTDEETGFRLTDWSGSWAPAPVDWDARPAFRGLQTAQQIEQWMAKVDEEMCGKEWLVLTTDVANKDGTTFHFAPDPDDKELLIQGDPAPRYWIPVVIGKQSPQTFWSELVKSNAPEPFHEGDLDDAKPWWELYEIQGGQFLKHLEQPAIEGFDPNETSNEKLARENDLGANHHTENRKRTERAKRDAQREKRRRAQEKARKFSDDIAVPSPDAIRPGLNLYIRSAKAADVPRVREIYNYYVQFTTHVPHMQQRTDKDVHQVRNECLTNNLPFLVACERGEVMKGRRNKNEGDIILPEKVVGFAFANDYSSMRDMYRFTAEIEVYVDGTYYLKGIAKCLLDKLIGMLDSDYLEKGGYDTVGEELEGIGPSRVISNILFNLPYDKPERLEWIGRWLSHGLGFKEVGSLDGIGNKAGKRYVIVHKLHELLIQPAILTFLA